MGRTSNPQSWKPFLPNRAVLMARPAPVRQIPDTGLAPTTAVLRVRLVFVTDASPETRDLQAQQLLDRMIDAMGVPRQDLVILSAEELERQVDALQPLIIVKLGPSRGPFQNYRGAKLIPTYDPAHLLRHPEHKKEAWADLKSVARELGISL